MKICFVDAKHHGGQFYMVELPILLFHYHLALVLLTFAKSKSYDLAPPALLFVKQATVDG